MEGEVKEPPRGRNLDHTHRTWNPFRKGKTGGDYKSHNKNKKDFQESKSFPVATP